MIAHDLALVARARPGSRGLALRRLLAAPRAFDAAPGLRAAADARRTGARSAARALGSAGQLARAPGIETLTPERGARSRRASSTRCSRVARGPSSASRISKPSAARPRFRSGSTCPARGRRPVPALVWLHGGRLGGRQHCDSRSTARGCSPSSRLRGGRRSATAGAGTSVSERGRRRVAAFCYVVEHAEQLGLDPRAIGVGGDSAGGNLAAVLCHEARERRLPAAGAAGADLPVTDFSAARRRTAPSPRDTCSRRRPWPGSSITTWATPRSRRIPARRRSITENFSELPPALIHTAGLRSAARRRPRLRRSPASSGHPLRYTCHAELTHGYWSLGGSVRAARRGDRGGRAVPRDKRSRGVR